MMTTLFGITIFLSAALLFWVQPMLGKLLLPPLGGSPTVWSTCLVFFQAMLLAGYAYAHGVTQKLGRRTQVITHGLLLAACALFLPFHIPAQWAAALTTASAPAVGLLGCLVVLAGLPLLVLSSTSPLLQRWFSVTPHRAATDPYFLYAASNLGSLVALLGYPLVIEPYCRLGRQSGLWAAGWALLALLIGACAVPVWRNAPARDGLPSPGPAATRSAEPLGWRRRGRWLLLSFAPSSLLLGATQYVVTDIASLPLLWVVPLSLYLLTFVLAFGRAGPTPGRLLPARPRPRPRPSSSCSEADRVRSARTSPSTTTRDEDAENDEDEAVGRIRKRPLSWLVAVLAVAVVFSLLLGATYPVGLLLGMHLAFLFFAALGCHKQLASDRPDTAKLTEFYLWMALGGALGGVFNALLAPQLFRDLTEYPLAIVLTALLQAERGPASSRWRWADLGWPAVAGLLMAWLALGASRLAGLPEAWRSGLIYGLPLVVAFFHVARPRRFGLALGAVLLASSVRVDEHGRTLHAERSFFGVSRVTLDPTGRFRHLVHGNTWHGAQFLDPARACEPLVYYHRRGPAGELFAAHAARHRTGNVAVIGLGTGSLACYGRPAEPWTFYEIDPAVIRLAQDTNCFTYLGRCAPQPVRIVQGDARQRLREAPAGAYTLLVVDAFSSDAIPVHLLTREALAEYLAKLRSGGLLAFHISSRYLDLERVLAGLADEAGLAGVVWDEGEMTPQESEQGRAASHWVVVGRRREDFGPLGRVAHWLPLEHPAGLVWSDDFSNLLGIVRWK
jgi:spermidine synthase